MFRLLPLLLFVCVLSAAQTDFEELVKSAGAAREANELPKAIELYRSALQLHPDWPEGLFYLGSLLYDSDQFAAAEPLLNRFVKAAPGGGPALALLGLCEFETGHFAESLTHIQQAGEQGGQMAAVLRFHEAQLLTKTGQYDKALPLFASFLNDGEAPKPVVIPLGIAALRRPLLATEIKPDQSDLYTSAGQTAAAILSGDPERSKTRLADLLVRFPNSAGVHYLDGFYALAQNPALAMDEFKRELAHDEANAAANYMLAWLLLNHREVAAALPFARKGASLAPADPLAGYVYGRALAEGTDVKEGIAQLEKAAAADPQNLEIHLGLASAYSKAGRTPEARRERDRSVELAREAAPVYIH